jgi:hypothetical protein
MGKLQNGSFLGAVDSHLHDLSRSGRQDGFPVSDFEAETGACLEPGTGDLPMSRESRAHMLFLGLRRYALEEKLLPASGNLKRPSGPSDGLDAYR